MPHTFEQFKNQTFDKLKRDLLAKRELFEDTVFPACNKSIYYSRQVSQDSIIWKRPYEIVKQFTEPHFIKYYPNTLNLDSGTGYKNKSYFIKVLTAIVNNKDLLDQIVPYNNEISKQARDYVGLVHFRLWKDGYWFDVCIDDRLPVYADTNKLVFCNNFVYQDEFWAALLEKALAKLNSSYENLDGYCVKDLLTDLTGGIHDSLNIINYSDKYSLLWDFMIQSRRQKHIMGVNIKTKNGKSSKMKLSNGLIEGQLYLITRVALVVLSGTPYKLVRLFNFDENEKTSWNGSWSNESKEWNLMNDDLKEAFDYKNLPKNEFWIDFNGICANFDNLEICYLSPDSFYMPNSINGIEEEDEEEVKTPKMSPMKILTYHGEWKENSTAGGCGQNNEALFWTNPQFLFTLNSDKNDIKEISVIISLYQKNVAERRTQKYVKSYFKLQNDLLGEHLQFRLFKVKTEFDAEYASRTGTRLYASQLEKYIDSGVYINQREISKKFKLEYASYILVPTCYDANRPGEFLLRILSENSIDDVNVTVKELDKHKSLLLSQDLFFFKKQEPEIDYTRRQTAQLAKAILSPIFEKFDKKTWLQDDIDSLNSTMCSLM